MVETRVVIPNGDYMNCRYIRSFPQNLAREKYLNPCSSPPKLLYINQVCFTQKACQFIQFARFARLNVPYKHHKTWRVSPHHVKPQKNDEQREIIRGILCKRVFSPTIKNREGRRFLGFCIFVEAKGIVILVATRTRLTNSHLREFMCVCFFNQICKLNTPKIKDMLECWTFVSMRE